MQRGAAQFSFLIQEPHANMLYKHYYYFVTEFSLVTQRELDALVNLLFFIILSRSSPDSLVYWPLILEAVKLQFT